MEPSGEQPSTFNALTHCMCRRGSSAHSLSCKHVMHVPIRADGSHLGRRCKSLRACRRGEGLRVRRRRCCGALCARRRRRGRGEGLRVHRRRCCGALCARRRRRGEGLHVRRRRCCGEAPTRARIRDEAYCSCLLRAIVTRCAASPSARLACLHSLAQLDRLQRGSRAEATRNGGVIPRMRGDVHPDLTAAVLSFTLHPAPWQSPPACSHADRLAAHTAVCPMCTYAARRRSGCQRLAARMRGGGQAQQQRRRAQAQTQ